MSGAKVAVIYQNDIAYSQGIRDTFVAEAEAKSLEVVYEGTSLPTLRAISPFSSLPPSPPVRTCCSCPSTIRKPL